VWLGALVRAFRFPGMNSGESCSNLLKQIRGSWAWAGGGGVDEYCRGLLGFCWFPPGCAALLRVPRNKFRGKLFKSVETDS
jgi:hypothetical protein